MRTGMHYMEENRCVVYLIARKFFTKAERRKRDESGNFGTGNTAAGGNKAGQHYEEGRQVQVRIAERG